MQSKTADNKGPGILIANIVAIAYFVISGEVNVTKEIFFMKTDGDFEWLLQHIPEKASPNIHKERVEKVETVISNIIVDASLPVTIGLFGTWGSGKTTFLAILAQRLKGKKVWQEQVEVIYFNAWKYAGFQEIVPSLIYKILKFGLPPSKKTEKLIAKIMLSLGKEYADKLGEWAEKYISVNPVEIFKDLVDVGAAIKDETTVTKKLLDSYYTQVDRAQDLLQEQFEGSKLKTIVLIDELDRCDPDEAFFVIKQLRVFFSMRNIPIVFILCANPEPIGLAIKHRYGLDSATSDYEARKILEKFVDLYIDMSEPFRLEEYVKWLWNKHDKLPEQMSFVSAIDEKYVDAALYSDTVKNATAFQAISTGNPIYANLRLLQKSLDYVCSRSFPNKHLLWTAWHLEMAEQMDIGLRREITTISAQIRDITRRTYQELLKISYVQKVGGNRQKISLNTDKGQTMFGAFRSYYWEIVQMKLNEMEEQGGYEMAEARRIIKKLSSDYKRMDFVVLMSLLPFKSPITLPDANSGDFQLFSADLQKGLMNQFGWLLANY
jgi:hypothetical protein